MLIVDGSVALLNCVLRGYGHAVAESKVVQLAAAVAEAFKMVHGENRVALSPQPTMAASVRLCDAVKVLVEDFVQLSQQQETLVDFPGWIHTKAIWFAGLWTVFGGRLLTKPHSTIVDLAEALRAAVDDLYVSRCRVEHPFGEDSAARLMRRALDDL